MSTLDELFSQKLTENGDLSYNKVSSDENLLNILFLIEYLQKHLEEVLIGKTDRDKLFSMFIRDPRFGLGRRDLGRRLMVQSGCSPEQIVKAGRFDDLMFYENRSLALDFWYKEIAKGNELAKKWAPRYSSKYLLLARNFAHIWGMNKQEYGHFIKCNTTENKLSRKNTREINFEHVPSLAMIKYAKRFANGLDTKGRYAQYLADVKAGKKELKIATTTVYDIYRNRQKIDADLFFSKIEKISGSWIPVVDTSGSMWDTNDSIGKALAVGHYLAKCSTYCPNKVVSFSSCPQLITLGQPRMASFFDRRGTRDRGYKVDNFSSVYNNEIDSMITGDCSNTDFGAVLNLLKGLDKFPEYLIVLSDMEFDCGSRQSKEELEELWKINNCNTKIVWWNFNSRNITCPEMDNRGNIFLSGYNPMLLKFLQAGFDGKKFLDTLLEEYSKNIGM